MLTPAEQVDYMSLLGMSFDKNGKQHFAPSAIKILYHLYNFGKGNAQIFPESETIAGALNLHRETVSNFVNSPQFKFYGQKIRRSFTSNLYRLHPWVVECFKSLEKLGFMQNFRSNFKLWRTVWKMRMPHFYIQKLVNLSTWAHLFESKAHRTKLSTKLIHRPDTVDPHRPDTTRPSGFYEGFRKTNTGYLSTPIIQEVAQVAQELENRFSIKDGDIRWIMNNLNLKEIKGGIRIRESMKGFYPDSPIKGYMSCVNQYRQGKKNAR